VHCSQHFSTPTVTTPTRLYTTPRILLLGSRSTSSLAVLQPTAALSLRSARGPVTRPQIPGANDPGTRLRKHSAHADHPYTPPICPQSCPTTTSKLSSALFPRLPTKSTPLRLPNSTSHTLQNGADGYTLDSRVLRSSPMILLVTPTSSSSWTSRPPTVASSGIKKSTTLSSTTRTGRFSTPLSWRTVWLA
jgi:hypothetical protein